MRSLLFRLQNATRINAAPYFERVRYWVDKQQMLVVALEDLAALVDTYKASQRDAPKYEGNPMITMPDPRPKIRLGLVVESVCAAIYGMTEIATNFANRLTAKRHEGQLPQSFRQLKKNLRDGQYPKLAAVLGDLKWHDTLHAMRTEWTHFSTIFIGEDGNQDPIVVGADLRFPADKQFLPSRFEVSIAELHRLAVASIVSMDAFAGYLLPLVVDVLLSKFDLDEVTHSPVFDKNGMMVMRANHTVEMRQITRRQQLEELGLADMLPPATPVR